MNYFIFYFDVDITFIIMKDLINNLIGFLFTIEERFSLWSCLNNAIPKEAPIDAISRLIDASLTLISLPSFSTS
jgi:hypothetical protein